MCIDYKKELKNKILAILTIFFVFTIQISCQKTSPNYICPPCEKSCDSLAFEKDGVCPHCSMNLIMNVDTTKINEVTLKEGSGNFLIEGGHGKKEKVIRVFYHQPSKFSTSSRVLLVLPGAGRNGDDYRDTWVQASEKYNLLVLSLEYSEKDYPRAWSYNLAGMITDVEMNKKRTTMTDFKISDSPDEWIYNDFDRLFDLVKNEFQLITNTYDMFGHSAGGQLLHRLAIFKSDNKANRILASNAGWYTVPNNKNFPIGLKNSNRVVTQIDFSSNLVLFLGEKDDANETRGHLRRSPEVDKQGADRLARGKHFYQTSKNEAKELGAIFNWKLEIVPNVGHDFREISKAAAIYLYKNPE